MLSNHPAARILKRPLSEAALAELSGAHITIHADTAKAMKLVKGLIRMSAMNPDLRQHPEWLLLEDWLHDQIDDALDYSAPLGGFLPSPRVAGIIDDVEVLEWLAAEQDIDDGYVPTDTERLAFIDEYVRRCAEGETEDFGMALHYVTIETDSGVTLDFAYACETDCFLAQGAVGLATAGITLAHAVATLESMGRAVGLNLWLTRPDQERLAAGYRQD